MSANAIYGISFKATGANQVAAEIKSTDDALAKLKGSADNVTDASKRQAAETEKLVGELHNLRASLSPVYAEQLKISQGTDTLNRSLAAGVIQQKEYDSSIKQIGSSGNTSSGYLRSLAASLALVVSVSALTSKIDEYTAFTSQLKLATNSQSQFNEAYQNSIDIARTAQTGISDTGRLYARIDNSLKSLGATQTDVSNITETVSLALKVSGATAIETSSAMLQLSQSFGSGVFRGEEFNAVNEAAPALLKALAASIGVPVGALKDMASNGLLTSDVLANAFKSPILLASLREQALQVRTISSAYVGLTNELTISIGEFDKATGTSKLLASSISFLANNMGILLPIVGGVAAVLLAISAPAILAGLAAVGIAVAAIGLPIAGIIAGLTAAGVAYAVFSKDSRTELQKLIDKEYELKKVHESQDFGAKTGGTILAEKNQRAYADATTEVIRRTKELGDLQAKIRFNEALTVKPIFGALDVAQAKIKETELTEKLSIAIDQQNKLRKIAAEGLPTEKKLIAESSVSYQDLAKEIGVASIKIAKFKEEETQLASLLKQGKITQEQFAEGTAKINQNRQAFYDGIANAAKKSNVLSDEGKQKLKELQHEIEVEGQLSETAYKQKMKAQQDFTDGLSAARKATDDLISSAQADIATTQRQIDVMAMGEVAVNALEIARINETAAAYEENAAYAKQNGVAQENIDYIEAQARALRDLANAREKSSELDHQLDATKNLKKVLEDAEKTRVSVAKKANDQQEKDFQKSVENIDQIFREGFAGLLNGGASNWKAWTKSLSTTFKTTVADSIYKQLAQPFVVKIIASLLGITGNGSVAGVANAAASASSFGGLGNTASISDSLYKGLTDIQGSITSGIEQLGVYLSNGNGGVADAIGGFLGQHAGSISNAMPFAGAALQAFTGDIQGAAFTAAGAAIGSFIPGLGTVLGGTIGSMLGSFVGSLGGTEDPNARVSTSYSAGKLTSSSAGKQSGGTFDTGIAGGLSTIQGAFATSLTTLLGAFKQGTDINLQSQVRAGDIFQAALSGTVNGAGIGVNGWEGQAADIKQFAELALGKGLADAIQSTGLSASIKALFSGLIDSTQVSNMVTATVNLNSVQKELASRFGLTVDAAAQVSKATGYAGADLVTYVNYLSQSALVYRSQSEIFIEARDKLTASLGQPLAASLEAFDANIKTIDKSSADGIAKVATLLTNRASFAAYQTTLDSMKNGVSQSLFGLRSPQEQLAIQQADLGKLFGSLNLAVPTSTEELIKLGESITTTTKEGLDLALAFPNLVAAFKTVKDSSDTLTTSLSVLGTSVLGADAFTSLVNYAQYKRVSSVYGVPFANNYIKSVPSFAVGTNYLPSDMLIQAHKGERIVPAADNKQLFEQLNNPQLSSLLIQQLEYLRSELKSGQEQIIKQVGNTYDVLKKFDNVGMPPVRTIA